jgi:hypothetical protein
VGVFDIDPVRDCGVRRHGILKVRASSTPHRRGTVAKINSPNLDVITS